MSYEAYKSGAEAGTNRNGIGGYVSGEADLDELRREVDEADALIMEAFERRMEAIDKIGAYKRRNGIGVEDKGREKQKFESIGEGAYSGYGRELLEKMIELSKLYQGRALNVYLTGMPASGKSEAAKNLERQTGRQAVDTDVIVSDRASATIEEIFEAEGEEGFREREWEALQIVAEHGGLIVATGGGVITRRENIELMRASGYVIFLDVPLDRLIKTPIVGRPLIRTTDDVTRLYYERIVDYKSNADMVVDPESLDFMARVIGLMEEKNLIVRG